MKLATIACNHETKAVINGEMVCTKCGVVLTDDIVEPPIERNSKTNLYERHATGSKNLIPKMEETSELRRYIKNASDRKSKKIEEHMKQISNCCQKLNLREIDTEFVFRLYRQKRNVLGSRKYAYVAVWALYRTCKANAIPISHKEIINVVKSEFRKSKFPHISKILYQMRDYDTSIINNDERYSFFLALRELTAGKKFTDKKFAEIQRESWKLYTTLFNEGSCRQRARKSIKLILGGAF